MSTITGLFEKLNGIRDPEVKQMCEEAQTLYLSVIKGRITSVDVVPYVQQHQLLERMPEQHRKDYANLLDLIARFGAAQ